MKSPKSLRSEWSVFWIIFILAWIICATVALRDTNSPRPLVINVTTELADKCLHEYKGMLIIVDNHVYCETRDNTFDLTKDYNHDH